MHFLGRRFDILQNKEQGVRFFLLHLKESEYFVVLKCDPDRTVELREKYQGITKGFYTGDTLKWNDLYVNVPKGGDVLFSFPI
ncbi:MAG: MmcQ/YjbR family DNA-binding protein [Bacteroidales bacterium]|nr:MmcQ/YjbR family DNA-binding protein [Bacteroidales bacterium]